MKVSAVNKGVKIRVKVPVPGTGKISNINHVIINVATDPAMYPGTVLDL